MKQLLLTSIILFVLACSSFEACSDAGFTLPVYHINHPKYRAKTFSFKKATAVAQVNHKFPYTFLVEFEVGTPPLSVVAQLDTGSTFVWLSFESFNFGESSSYEYIECSDKRCDDAPVNRTCQRSGYIGEETFTFMEDVDNVKSTSVRMVMGNQYYDNEANEGNYKYPGILGLGYDRNELLKKMNVDKFSICLPRRDQDFTYMRFGDKARLLGGSTNLTLVSNHYYFNVTAIAVAYHIVPVPLWILQRPSARGTGYSGGFVFDTGASVTNLHTELMDVIMTAMEKEIGLPGQSENAGVYEYCYDAEAIEKIKNFKRFEISLQFGVGNWLNLGYLRTWRDVGNFVCLAFLRSTRNVTVFGVWQMKDINFGLDIGSKVLHYQNSGYCAN